MQANKFSTSSEAIAIRTAELANRDREDQRRIEKVTIFLVEHAPLKALWEVETERRNFCDDYENYYRAMDVVNRQLPQTYENLAGNPEGCELATRIINRLREGAMNLIPYGATVPNKDSYGRRHGRMV